jgi:hypothetical protein
VKTLLRCLALMTLVLGPGSLRMLHERTAHMQPLVVVADTAHHDHDAHHHADRVPEGEERHHDDTHCVTCSDLSTMTVDVPLSLAIDAPRPRARPALCPVSLRRAGIEPLRITRAQPPPQA